MTSSYCLLAYIPFTYHWVIKCTLVKWLPVFVTLHPFLYWLVIVIVGATLVPELHRSRTRRLACGFIIFHLAAGVMLLFNPLLSGLANDNRSFSWSMISLFPLLWISAIDHAGHNRERKWAPTDNEHLTVSTAMLAAVFLSLLYFGMSYLRVVSTGGIQLRSSELLVASTWGLASHGLVFTFAFVTFELIRGFARRFARASEIEFFICNLLFALVLAVLVRKMILSALTFNNYLADVFSVIVSFSSVALMSGLSVRLQAKDDANLSGFELAVAPLLLVSPGRKSRWQIRLIWIGLIALLAYAIPASVATRDWDFLMAEVGRNHNLDCDLRVLLRGLSPREAKKVLVSRPSANCSSG
jgi:hypothetical protein